MYTFLRLKVADNIYGKHKVAAVSFCVAQVRGKSMSDHICLLRVSIYLSDTQTSTLNFTDGKDENLSIVPVLEFINQTCNNISITIKIVTS
jgi:hypothetical protein